MNERFNSFKHDAILHLNRRKVANPLFPLVKLSNRTGQVELDTLDFSPRFGWGICLLFPVRVEIFSPAGVEK
jgi:hypothetical protein